MWIYCMLHIAENPWSKWGVNAIYTQTSLPGKCNAVWFEGTRLCMSSWFLENTIPSSHQPGGLLHSDSLKRYGRFMPQGLGEHSLHFRAINLQFFLGTALPMLEDSLGTVVPSFDYGDLLKHWQTLARSCLERTTIPCLLQLVSWITSWKRQKKTEREGPCDCEQLVLWWVRAELKRKILFLRGDSNNLLK